MRVSCGACRAALFLVVAPGQADPVVERSARSIIEANCLTCHGAARMSDLDLRQRETILEGGKRGPAVVPGKAAESLLYKAVMRQGELQMPPGKDALPSAAIRGRRDWIDRGAVGTGRHHSPLAFLVGLPEARAAAGSSGQQCRLGAQPHRRFPSQQAPAERPSPRRYGRPPQENSQPGGFGIRRNR